MRNSNVATLTNILSEGAFLKLLFIILINLNFIFVHCIFIVSCFISGHLRKKLIETFSLLFFFSERAVKHVLGAWCHSSSFRPWVLHNIMKEPPDVTTETCPLIVLWQIHRITTMPDDFYYPYTRLFRWPEFYWGHKSGHFSSYNNIILLKPHNLFNAIMN